MLLGEGMHGAFERRAILFCRLDVASFAILPFANKKNCCIIAFIIYIYIFVCMHACVRVRVYVLQHVPLL